MRGLMRFAAESDEAGTVDRFGMRQMNAALCAFDHRLRSATGSWGSGGR